MVGPGLRFRTTRNNADQLSGMLSALTLLLDTPLNPEQLELARVIEESGEVLVQVINDILDYSKLAQGGFSISHDIISVVDIIQSVFRVQTKSCKPEISLEIHLDPRLPTAAEGDSLRYRQIVQNLLSNATKFTDEGYVRVNATLQKEDADSYIIMTEVIDTGVGIPPGLSGSLFQPFVQFDNSATKRYKGTGLGLSICKSLSGLMEGEIGFHANPEGRGSVFWFTVKLKKVQQFRVKQFLQDRSDAQKTSPNSISAESLKPVAAKKRILLTEDNPINQKVMVKMLKGLGFANIDLATDGRQAVTMATKDPPPYHLILMDINMPILDGVSATRELRSAGLTIPIVGITANALKGQAESYLAKGMTAYVAKPVDRKLLVEILWSCLKDDTPE